MSLELFLAQKTSQQLMMTLQLKQAIKIMGLNNEELAGEIEEQLRENPLLEKESNVSANEETEIYYARDNNEKYNNEQDYDRLENTGDSSRNLLLELWEQIDCFDLSRDEQSIFAVLISNLNEQGYLRTTKQEVSAQTDCSEEVAEKLITMLRSLEPAGIGAYDLADCLQLQLERMGQSSSLAYRIVSENINMVAENNTKLIASTYTCSEQAALAAIELIKTLNPKPLGDVSSSNAGYIVPDLKIVQTKTGWKVLINEESLPKLSISSYYLDLINNGQFSSKQEKGFLNKKHREANCFLEAIFQRNNTMRNVADKILQHQFNFLKLGNSGVKPLVLKDIAEELEIHESTVSRAVSNKFIDTPRGIYPLKFFFSTRLNQSGADVSAMQIKAKIKTSINSEEPSKPLSDQKLCDLLKKEDLTVARRTVAKYREELKIPTARKRKKTDKSV